MNCLFFLLFFTDLNTTHLSFNLCCLPSFCCICSNSTFRKSICGYFISPTPWTRTEHISQRKSAKHHMQHVQLTLPLLLILQDISKLQMCKLNTYCNCAHNLEKSHQHNKAFVTLPVWPWNKEGLRKCDSKESSFQPLVN